MAARAVVIRYSNEMVTFEGNFQVEAHFLICDPARPQGSNNGLTPLASSEVVVLDATAPATWAAAIENAVIARGVGLGFTDLVAATTFIPTIA